MVELSAVLISVQLGRGEDLGFFEAIAAATVTPQPPFVDIRLYGERRSEQPSIDIIT